MTADQSNWLRKRTWAEINLDHLAHNMEVTRKLIGPDVAVMAVVKSDAYGHGDRVIAPELERLGADWLGVSELEEGLALRRYGVTKPALCFTGIPVEYCKVAVKNNITTILPGLDYANELNDECREQGVKINAHLSIDTGIGRLGLEASESKSAKTLKDIKQILSLKNINTIGIYTHFASAGNKDTKSQDYTNRQFERFNRLLEYLKKDGIELPLKHTCNSAGMLASSDYHCNMVREGINLYDGPPELGFKAIMSLKTKITLIKEVEVGTSISYNCIFTAQRPTRVATVSLGYGDGYHRAMSGKAQVLVSGKKVPVIGNICMDQMMLDITDVQSVKVGDTVTVVGTDGESKVTWSDLAGWAETINYEMTCGITRRIPRIYRKGGKDVDYLSYQNFAPEE